MILIKKLPQIWSLYNIFLSYRSFLGQKSGISQLNSLFRVSQSQNQDISWVGLSPGSRWEEPSSKLTLLEEPCSLCLWLKVLSPCGLSAAGHSVLWEALHILSHMVPSIFKPAKACRILLTLSLSYFLLWHHLENLYFKDMQLDQTHLDNLPVLTWTLL